MAKLLMELLEYSNTKTKTGFRECLHSLPDAPDEAYRQLWARILSQEENDAILARQIFSWVTFSEQPLTIKDLQYGLHLSTDPQIWPFDADDLIPEEELGSVCLGVIALKPKTSVIAFVHHTAEIFFPRFLISEFAIEAQRQIAVSCMRYIKLLGRSEACAPDKDIPLQAYAGVHWGTHVAKAGPAVRSIDVVELLTNEGDLRRASTLLQQTLWKDNHSMFRTRVPVIESITSLHLAAYFGLIEVTDQLLSKDEILIDHGGDGYWTALRWAVISQQSEMVLHLTTQGAELEIPDDDGNDVLMWALGHGQDYASFGDFDIYDCSIHIGNTYHYGSLDQMIAHPHYDTVVISRTSSEILRFLVTNTTAINKRNIAGRSTLSIAAENRHTDLVDHLLHRGANMDLVDNNGMTALLWALQPKRQHLFENINVYGDACVHIGLHITVDSSIRETHDPLKSEDDSGRYESMLLLLVGCQLDAKDTFGRTALSLAAGKGLSVLANTLLESGADVTIVDDSGRTAYNWASLRPMSHRTRVDKVNVFDSAKVLIGVQCEWRNFGSDCMPTMPKMDESRTLLAATLLEHLSSQRQEASEFDLPVGTIDDGSAYPQSVFSSIAANDNSRVIVGSSGTGTWIHTEELVTNSSANGCSRVVFGALGFHSPVTFLDELTSEELGARNIIIRKMERDSGPVTEVFRQKLAARDANHH
jgi:ankyrin repeat protein